MQSVTSKSYDISLKAIDECENESAALDVQINVLDGVDTAVANTYAAELLANQDRNSD